MSGPVGYRLIKRGPGSVRNPSGAAEIGQDLI